MKDIQQGSIPWYSTMNGIIELPPYRNETLKHIADSIGEGLVKIIPNWSLRTSIAEQVTLHIEVIPNYDFNGWNCCASVKIGGKPRYQSILEFTEENWKKQLDLYDLIFETKWFQLE